MHTLLPTYVCPEAPPHTIAMLPLVLFGAVIGSLLATQGMSKRGLAGSAACAFVAACLSREPGTYIPIVLGSVMGAAASILLHGHRHAVNVAALAATSAAVSPAGLHALQHATGMAG